MLFTRIGFGLILKWFTKTSEYRSIFKVNVANLWHKNIKNKKKNGVAYKYQRIYNLITRVVINKRAVNSNNNNNNNSNNNNSNNNNIKMKEIWELQ